MNSRCQIELLGELRVRQGDRLITRFRGQKTTSLLGYLAYSLLPHSREALIELLWPECEPDAGRNRLSTELSSLRKQLEPPGVPSGSVLVANRYTVGLNPAAIETDVADFQALLQEVEASTGSAERVAGLARAAELYRGPLLPTCYEDWVSSEREHLLEAYLGALGQLVKYHERTGGLPLALEYSRRALAADPLREEAYREVMRLYVVLGKPQAALRQYRKLERLLKQEFGEEPAPALRAFAQQILTLPPSPPPSGLPLEVGTPSASVEPKSVPPTGTVTFLLTDIEGSTLMGENARGAYGVAVDRHHRLIREEFRRFGGHEAREMGDGFLAAFQGAGDALACARESQTALALEPWPNGAELRVRMALHTGDVERKGEEYQGLVLHRASRILSAAHGGQVLCSEATATVLRRDLEPGVGLRDLGLYRLRDVPTPERLFQVEWPEMPRRDFPLPKAEAGYASSLPLTFTRFFGREKELARLEELLALPSVRLLTLTGPGGSGKSRLALEVSRMELDPMGGAVWFVELADVTDPALIVGEILGAMKLYRNPNTELLEQVIGALGGQPALLVLDNFEQLVEGGAEVVRALLERLPSLTCLVTSRQVLGLEGEHEFPVPQLPTPHGEATPEGLTQYESVRLFVDRAQAVRADFGVTAGNAPAVAELCHRLEGIPLALELAAARIGGMTPAQMLAQLGQRFQFLVSRRRDVAERHKTLWNTIDWSYRQLSPEQQRFFRSLSIFRGDWTEEAARVVCGEPLALERLEELREASLIFSVAQEEVQRFGMLETVREFAWGQLGPEEIERLRADAADYFLHLAERNLKETSSLSERSQALNGVERELDNFRALLEHSLVNDPLLALRLCCVLGRFWDERGYLKEGRRYTEAALARVTAPSPELKAEGLYALGRLAVHQNDWETAEAHLKDSLALWDPLGNAEKMARVLGTLGAVEFNLEHDVDGLAHIERALSLHRASGDRRGEARTLLSLALYAESVNEVEAAEAHLRGSIAIYEEVGEEIEIRGPLHNLGNIARTKGNLVQARDLFLRSMKIDREMGDIAGIACGLIGLSTLSFLERDFESALRYAEEALEIYRKMGNCTEIINSLSKVGWASLKVGRAVLASDSFTEALLMSRGDGDPEQIGYFMEAFAAIAVSSGQGVRAARLYGASEALEGGNNPGNFLELLTADFLPVLDSLLSPEEKTAAWEEGRSMTMEQTLEFALNYS